MVAATHSARAAVSPALKRARQLIAASLVQAMRELDASQGAVARWTKKSARTVRNWVHEQNPINVEAVLASSKLGERFRRALCTHDHDEPARVAHDAPYLLRARKGAKQKRRAKPRSKGRR